MRTRTARPIPAPSTAHLALPDSAVTLCAEPFGPGRLSTVVKLYVPLERLQSLSDACPLCRAAGRRLQAASPVLALRVVIAAPAHAARPVSTRLRSA